MRSQITRKRERINPNDAEAYAQAYNGRGIAHYRLGYKQRAIADYDQALRINPNLAIAYYNRGKARSELGDKHRAIVDYNEARAN